MINSDLLINKWKPVLECEGMPAIVDFERRAAVAQILENQLNDGRSEQSLNEAVPANFSGDLGGVNAATADTSTANIAGVDPIIINLIRRAMPNLMAYDVCGVQAMKGPTSIIFAMRSRYATDTSLYNNTEAFYNEADTDYSGTGTHAGNSPSVLNDPTPGAYTTGTGVSTVTGEDFGGATAIGKMGISIEKIAVTAQTRMLEAGYTTELAQDLKAVHGLSAETELSNVVSGELVAEINRQVIRTIYTTAKKGADNASTPGIFDLDNDTDGRWQVEKFKGLVFQIDRDAGQIAKETRRGLGNFIICSTDLASALSSAGALDIPMDVSRNKLNIDATGNTFAGVFNGKYKVYIDPYAPSSQNNDNNFYVVGYKGTNSWDAGLFYCPYVPLQLFKVVDPNTYQPKIAFKTRFGLVANPFAEGTTIGAGRLQANSNVYYRRVSVTNISGV